MEYPTAKFQSNPCLAREGEKPLGNFSHFPATAEQCKAGLAGTVLVQDTSEPSKSSNTKK